MIGCGSRDLAGVLCLQRDSLLTKSSSCACGGTCDSASATAISQVLLQTPDHGVDPPPTLLKDASSGHFRHYGKAAGGLHPLSATEPLFLMLSPGVPLLDSRLGDFWNARGHRRRDPAPGYPLPGSCVSALPPYASGTMK
jgi:hypothetical protein